jgi:hypothetical protein
MATSSVLSEYVNSYFSVTESSAPIIEDGRFVDPQTNKYVISLFLKRSQGTSTDTGGREYKLPSSGASGTGYLYRGYMLGISDVSNEYDIYNQSTPPDELVYDDLMNSNEYLANTSAPEYIRPGVMGSVKFGSSSRMTGIIIECSGVYGDLGIDQIIASEIRGLPIVLRISEILN